MQSRYFKYIILLAFLSNALISSGQQVRKTDPADSLAKAWDKTIPGNFSGQSKAVFDSSAIARFFEKYPEVIAYKDQLQNFYSTRRYAYAWFDDGTLIEQAGNLSNRVMNLQKDGIYKSIPYQRVDIPNPLTTMFREIEISIPQHFDQANLLMLNNVYNI